MIALEMSLSESVERSMVTLREPTVTLPDAGGEESPSRVAMVELDEAKVSLLAPSEV